MKYIYYSPPHFLVDLLVEHNLQMPHNCLRCRLIRRLLTLHRIIFDRVKIHP